MDRIYLPDSTTPDIDKRKINVTYNYTSIPKSYRVTCQSLLESLKSGCNPADIILLWDETIASQTGIPGCHSENSDSYCCLHNWSKINIRRVL